VTEDAGRRERFGVLALTVCCAACYLVTSFTVYAQYLGSGYDLGIFDQAVRAYADLRAPITPLKAPDFNILGDHFHPILALLAPAYWVWDDPGVLLIAQDVLVAVSIPVVYRFTRRRTGFAFSWTVAAVYGLSWPIQTLIDVQFHEVAVAIPLLALAIDALDRGDHKHLLLWCLPLLFVREDMGILVALLGLLAYLRAPRSAATTSWRARILHRPSPAVVALVVGGIAAYEIVTGLIIPALSPSHHFSYWQFDAIGKDLPDALGGIITRPWHAVHVFFSPGVKVRTMVYLVAPLAFLPLCSPYTVIALPLLAERFFNSRSELWTTHFQYNALPWLVLVLAFVDGAGRVGLFRATPTAEVARRVVAVLLVGAELVLTVVVKTQFRSLVPNTGRLISNHREAAALSAQRAGGLIPDRVCVQATERIAPHLTRRDRVTLPDLPLRGSDFIVLDLSRPNVGIRATPAAVLAAARAAGYVTVFSEGTVLVLRSPGYSGPSDVCGPLGRGK
jgi:uncharacterized membrane protein